jgi:tetratricopeptide (TPR) repeat protein
MVAAAFTLSIGATGLGLAGYQNSTSMANGIVAASFEPATPEAYLEQATQRQREGKYEDALKYYVKAGDLAENAATWVRMAYCNNRIDKHGQARHRYMQAMRAGAVSAAIWNNCGYSWFKAEKVSVDERLPGAFQAYSQAIALDGRCQAALVNRAELCLEAERLKLRGHPRMPSGTAALLQGLADIRQAIALEPESAELHLIAARLSARLSPRTEVPPIACMSFQTNPLAAICAMDGSSTLNSFRRDSLGFLSRAVELGIRPDDFRNDRALTFTMSGDRRFSELLKREPRRKERINVDRLVDPG